MNMLVTAFDAFGGEAINPALQALEELPESIVGLQLIKLEVPTVFGESLEVVRRALEKHRPDAVLCLGQAGGRSAITVERVAINVMDARMPDNKGYAPEDVPVIPGGPAAYFATLPIKHMVAGMQAAGVSAAVSDTAGTFVCNQLMYGVLHTLHLEGRGAIAGFVHVPYVPTQAQHKTPQPPSMPLEDINKGLVAATAAVGEILQSP